jgi:hypothetical protein
MTVATSRRPLTSPDGIGIAVAATRPADALLRDLGVTTTGLTAGEAAARLARTQPHDTGMGQLSSERKPVRRPSGRSALPGENGHQRY